MNVDHMSYEVSKDDTDVPLKLKDGVEVGEMSEQEH